MISIGRTGRAFLGMVFAFCIGQCHAASNGKLLHSFTGGADGGDPATTLTFDAAGNAYGTTVVGGKFGYGTVFELKPTTGGGYQEIVLHSFLSSPDGKNPYGGVTFDSAGNLYGVTAAGGASTCAGDGCGTVFELSPSGGGWSERVIYNFAGGSDGSGPGSGLVLDSLGNLYGTTPLGGANSAGTVFQLSPSSGGKWNEQVIHSFTGGPDGSTGSLGRLLLDPAGNLYGVTELGGEFSAGTAYRLSQSNGVWKLATIYAFHGQPDAGFPYGGLTADASGNLYGTTYYGGQYGLGTVFEISKDGHESVLYSFKTGTDGNSPTSTLNMNTAGAIFGTASAGGNVSCDCGVVFKLTPSNGTWSESVLHRFGNTPDGANPYYGFSADSKGQLYSTTAAGGNAGQGIVFSFKP